MVAHAQTDNPVFLRDAQRMLLRYAAKHQALFGDTETTRTERGQVYEILYEVEERLESVPEDVQSNGTLPAEATSVVQLAPPTAPATHAGEMLADNVREVEVRPPMDPRVRERLRSPYSNPFVPMVYLPPRLLHGPRSLVRLSGRIRAAAGTTDPKLGRQRGRELVRTARVNLRACYGDAFSRIPVMVARSTVDLAIDADGTVSHVRVVDGSLLDAFGDVCMIERLEGTQLSLAQADVNVRGPLLFFHQNAAYFDIRAGGTGTIKPGSQDPFQASPPNPDAIPVAVMHETLDARGRPRDRPGSWRF